MRKGRINRLRMILLVLDVLVLGPLVLVSSVPRLLHPRGWHGVATHMVDGLVFHVLVLLLTLFLLYLFGLYDPEKFYNPLWVITTTLQVVSMVLLGTSFIFLVIYKLPLGRIALGFIALTTFLAVVLIRTLCTLGMQQGWLGRKCFILGAGDPLSETLSLIRPSLRSGLTPLGILYTEGSDDAELPSEIEGIPVVGTSEMLDQIMEDPGIHFDALLIATNLEDDHELWKKLRPFRYHGIELIDLITLYEDLAWLIPLNYIDEEWLLRYSGHSGHFHIRKIKGIIDFFLSCIGLILFFPIALLVALLIKLDSEGPVLYKQERVGQQYQEYWLYKFRTMHTWAEKDSGPTWAVKQDNRVTRVGKFLRKFRIDEVPQLINVLKGEMSIVGPRPERMVFVKQLREQVPFYEERLLVRPGITGWAQVQYPYADDIEGSYEKLQYDLYYQKHISFALDLEIILKTIGIVLRGAEREHRGPDGQLPKVVMKEAPPQAGRGANFTRGCSKIRSSRSS